MDIWTPTSRVKRKNINPSRLRHTIDKNTARTACFNQGRVTRYPPKRVNESIAFQETNGIFDDNEAEPTFYPSGDQALGIKAVLAVVRETPPSMIAELDVQAI